MTQVNMYDAKTNLSKLAKLLEEGIEDYIVISRNGIPKFKLTLLEQNDVSKRIGVGKGLFEIPDDFDEMDISDMFDGEIFP